MTREDGQIKNKNYINPLAPSIQKMPKILQIQRPKSKLCHFICYLFFFSYKLVPT